MKNFTTLNAKNNAAIPLREMEMYREMHRANSKVSDKSGAIGRPVI